MALFQDLYLKKEILQTLINECEGQGISITVATSDKSNEYGQNVTAYLSQTKEERQDKVPKRHIGNGKVFWVSETGAVLGTKTK